MSVNNFQDSMSELRALCYPGTDVLMLCFSVVRPETFRSVAERWTKAVANVNAPLILVGTQSDLALDGKVIQGLKVRFLLLNDFHDNVFFFLIKVISSSVWFKIDYYIRGKICFFSNRLIL